MGSKTNKDAEWLGTDIRTRHERIYDPTFGYPRPAPKPSSTKKKRGKTTDEESTKD